MYLIYFVKMKIAAIYCVLLNKKLSLILPEVVALYIWSIFTWINHQEDLKRTMHT